MTTMTAGARRGRKNPDLLAQKVEAPAPEPGGQLVYVCGPRPLRVGELVVTEGVEVPGAADWPRVETWVSTRKIKAVRADSDYIPYEDFKAWSESEDGMTLQDFRRQLAVAQLEAEEPDTEE